MGDFWWAWYVAMCLLTALVITTVINITVPPLLLGEAGYSLVFTLILYAGNILAQIISGKTVDISGASL